MIKIVSAALATLVCVSASGVALAQSTAIQILRQGMQERGYYATYESGEVPVRDRQGEFHGLQMSWGEAWVPEGSAGTYLLVLRNTTSQAYCFWPLVTFDPAGWIVDSRRIRGSVAPGEHAVLTVASIQPGQYHATYSVAFWRPDESQPYGSQCAAAEPQGLQTWLADPNGQNFMGSVR